MPLFNRRETSRERLMTLDHLTVYSGISIPYLDAFFIISKTSAFFNNALVGIQPQLRQTPPKWLDSTIATFFPN